jgi:hypothetical protein
MEEKIKSDLDKELDPKRLRFGMTPTQIEEIKRAEKARRKKLAKGWKPIEH